MPNDWKTNEGKRAIVRAIFTKLREVPPSVAPETFVNCNNTKHMAETWGQTKIPDNVYVYGLGQGDRTLGAGCSLIIEIPPSGVPLDSEEILTYTCTYTLWKPTALEQELAAQGTNLAAFLSERGLDLAAKLEAKTGEK